MPKIQHVEKVLRETFNVSYSSPEKNPPSKKTEGSLSTASLMDNVIDLGIENVRLKKQVERLEKRLRWTGKDKARGLMRSSLFAAASFLVLMAVSVLGPIQLAHPLVALGGFLYAMGFFAIGALNWTELRNQE